MGSEQNKINDIRKLLKKGNLAKCIFALEKYAPEAGFYPELAEKVKELKERYCWLLNYYKEGAPDPEREKIFRGYRNSLYAIVQDLCMMEKRTRNSVLMAAAKKSAAIDVTTIRTKLAQMEDNKEYADYVTMVFSYILCSTHWEQAEENLFVDLLGDPAIDSMARQVLVSAIMMSCMCVFDFRKFEALVRIYQAASDAYIKERALVGWVFALRYDENEEQQMRTSQLVEKVCQDPAVRREILELQQQTLLCMDAEKDSGLINEQIIGNFSHSSMARQATQALMKDDLEEASLEEVLHPEQGEADMERWEENYKKLSAMEQAGSDIYFQGFSKMKSFGFFHTFAHWFWPFWPEHPALADICGKMGGSDTFEKLRHKMPFCNNDLYSFAFVTGIMLKQMGDKMKEVLQILVSSPKRPEALDLTSPAAIRRMYLQDLYRFFRLSSMAVDFPNPYQKEDARSQAYFLGHQEFQGKIFADLHLVTCRFLARKKDYASMRFFIESNMPRNNDYAMVMALYEFHAKHHYERAANHLTHVLLMTPDNMGAVRLLARCYMNMGDYEQAITEYRKLLRQNPDDMMSKLRIAYAQMQLGDYDEALRLLYELDYKQPGRLDVMRPLAWTQLKNGEVEKAIKVYEKIEHTTDKRASEDMAQDAYNQGLAYWCHRQTAKAAEVFTTCTQYASDFSLYDQLMDDKDVLRQYGYTQMDVLLMLDLTQLYPQL